MARELPHFHPALHIPQPRRLIDTAGEDVTANWAERAAGQNITPIGTECHTVYLCVMACELPYFDAALRIPQPRRPVATACQDILSIGTERDTGHRIGMAVKLPYFDAALRIPQPRRPI